MDVDMSRLVNMEAPVFLQTRYGVDVLAFGKPSYPKSLTIAHDISRHYSHLLRVQLILSICANPCWLAFDGGFKQI